MRLCELPPNHSECSPRISQLVKLYFRGTSTKVNVAEKIAVQNCLK